MMRNADRAQKAGPRSMCECAKGARSVQSGAAFLPRCSRDKKTLGHVHSSSLRLRLASHHLAVSLRLIRQTKTHPLARRLAAGLAVPARSSHHASHRVRRCVLSKCITLSDSLARRTGGSDSPLMRLLTFAPLSRCSLGPLGRDDLPPASLLPPLKGRAVIAIERGSVSGQGREDKATVTGRISGRSLALSGGSNRGDRVPTEN